MPRKLGQPPLVAATLGAASVLAFAPLGWFPLLWLTLAGLFALLDNAADAHADTGVGAKIGAAFGAGFFLCGVSWVYVSLSVFGGMPTAVAALATLLFCCVLSLYPALVGALFVRFAPQGRAYRAVFFAALWALSEWLRGWLFTGFPWLAVGYAQAPPSPLAGFAPLLGVYGVSLLSALLAALLYQGLRTCLPSAARAGRSPWQTAIPMLCVAGMLLGGQGLRAVRWTTPVGEPLSVALLQGNIPQDMKWRPEKFFESLSTYHQLASQHPAQLTVLPETALPAFLDYVPQEYLDELRKLALRQQGDILFGIPVGEEGGKGYANGAVSLGRAPQQRYSKSHLVPFGEFIPPGFAWFMAMAQIPMSSFTPGAMTQAPLALGGQKIAVNICYEDAFGEEIIRALPEATLLVNLSNVAWFGDSLAPAQHLQIARMRALESGRMMLRATNTGMTAIVDVDGEILASLPPFTRDALQGEVRGYAGSTPYVRWGNAVFLLLALALLLVGGKRKANGKTSGETRAS